MHHDQINAPTSENYLYQARKLLQANPTEAFDIFIKSKDRLSGFTDFLSSVQFMKKIPKEVRDKRAMADLKVAFIGNCTLTYLSQAVSIGLSPRISCQTFEGTFDLWAVDLIAPDSDLVQFNPDIVVLYLSAFGLTRGGTRLDQPPVEQITDALRSFASRHQTPFVIVLPEPLPDGTGGDSDGDIWYRTASQEIIWAAKNALGDRAVILDPVPTLLTLKDEWSSSRMWDNAKLPLPPNACIALGRRLSQMIENMTYPSVKVIAVDCDDTLWGGVVGEDGVAGLALSPFDQGAGHLRFQRLLKEAARKGLLLVAVSKNDMENVVDVFEQRTEMILSMDDFSLLKVNWQPKSQNLLEAANELGLGIDSFLFIDDSPFERGEVQAAFPEILVADLPESADDYATFISGLGILERPIVTEEDTKRTELYRQEVQRQSELKSGVSLDDFLSGLQLEVRAKPIDENNLARVTQLVSKTNQFNLTTPRYTREELSHLANDQDVYAYCYDVSDRLGDAGLTGVMIASPDGSQTYRIDTLLMSCRVMGRTVENAMFEHVRQWLVARGHKQLRGEYIPTKKNKPVADILPGLGFSREYTTEDRLLYLAHLDQPFDNPFAKITEAEN
jgi:FkbH-like protein